MRDSNPDINTSSKAEALMWIAKGWVQLGDEGSFGNTRSPRMALWHPRDGRTTSVRLSVGTSPLGGMELLSTAG